MPYLVTPTRRQWKPARPRLNRAHPMARGLVGAWVLGEGSGRTAIDSAGNNPGTHTGTATAYTPSRSGPVLSLTGPSSYVDCGNASSLSLTGPMTAIVSFFYPATTTANAGLFVKGNYTLAKHWYMQSMINNGVRWVVNYSGGGTLVDSGIFTADANQWHQAALTFDGTTWRCILDGFEYGTITTGAGDNTQPLTIGGVVDGETFSGLIEYAYLYNRAMPRSEIALLRADPFAMFRPAPIAWHWSTSTGGSTATLTVTLDGYGLTGSATHTGPPARTATLSQTLAAVTLSSAVTFVAAPARTGTLSQTLGSVTVASAVTHTGAAASSATLSQTLGPVTVQAQAGRPLVFLAIPSKVARTHKPTFPTLRNDHPLAQGLAFLTVPTIPGSRNLVDGSRGVLSSVANGGWSTPSLYEAAIESTSTTLGGAYWPFPQRLEGASDFTIAWLGRIDSRALNGKLVALPYRQDTTWSPPFTALAMFIPTQLGVELTDTSATRFESTSLGTVTDGQTRLYVITRRGTAIRAYRDGDVVATATLGTSSPIKFDALGATVRPNVYVMQRNHQNTGEGVDGLCSMAAIWNRALTDGEIEQLWVEPFAMVRPRPTLLVGSQSIPGSIGSLTATTDAVTLSGAATFTAAPARTGTLSQTLGSVTMTGAATFTAAPARTGTLSQTLGSVTLTSGVTAGAPGTVTGTLTQTLASVSLTSAVTFAGVGGSSATLSATLGSVTFTGAATHTGPPSRTATLSVTLGNVTLVGQIGNPGGSEWRGGSLVATYWAGGTISATAWTGGTEN